MQPKTPERFAALGDPVRLAVVRALLDGPMRSSDLAGSLDVGRPTMSKHLRVLHDAGLVQVQTDPADHRARVYTLERKGFVDLSAFLAEVERFWQDELAAFKAFAEEHR